MEARHDLGKFITELSVAQRGVVLSSGRGVSGELMIAQGGVMVSARSVLSHRRGSVDRKNRRNDNVVRLTPEAGIETSTRMGSDQKATEALQEAETEVVIARKVDWVRVSGRPTRRSMSALRPES
ncbi:hypothetical protein FHR83_007372 [Actinoplanes campanulatus]|uniref:Uncharacterized protein n=1 Tax=Actinoplanes campanulatus TaxID=113559 RepID=A0A7W5ANR1_9ACTN|nr:hypothetical protein [Actinoplanes campanulatus]MBB3099663.1 hypothetical protein [Actinoplanes campanulatus]GGN25890.1 hypothetical protein GCM10010109_42450 [Actinoplanes campanulatus]GID41556.1 hypothetical protein Aca09nite_80620 [Actinoplanes campanulatus]